MKLYSRGQVIFYTVCGFIVALAVAMGFGLIQPPASARKKAQVEQHIAPTIPEQFELSTSDILSVEDSRSQGEYSEEESVNIRIYEALNPAVVNITTQTLALNWFMEPVPSEGGTGSGSIIDNRGYILTNNHVVENAYKVTITMADSSQYPGEVIGKDPENDLAVVKFEPEGKQLTTISFGTSSGLRVGQKVLAIGNPFGYDR
ncbi:MAG: trypsin-like peptidase domain-containing protein, partial [Spirochaetales bacterium]|nr:trypsin-like peptidase domain-containing protein [Spirochaetales bacterium]